MLDRLGIRGPRSPTNFRNPGPVVRHASHDEEQVREPVQVHDYLTIHGIRSETDDAAFRPSADSPSQVKERSGL